MSIKRSFGRVLRGVLQVWLWFALVYLLATDYKVIEYFRHGPDVLHFDSQGRMLPRPPLSIQDYGVVAVLITVQALLVLGLYRLHRRRVKQV